jgi:hypothetical protein
MAQQGGESGMELAALWCARLDKAKAAYDLAAAEFRHSAEEYRYRQAPSADGSFALRHAITAENAARAQYVHVLQVFTDLIVNGKVPPQA